MGLQMGFNREGNICVTYDLRDPEQTSAIVALLNGYLQGEWPRAELLQLQELHEHAENMLHLHRRAAEQLRDAMYPTRLRLAPKPELKTTPNPTGYGFRLKVPAQDFLRVTPMVRVPLAGLRTHGQRSRLGW